MRVVHDESAPRVYAGILDGLDAIAVAAPTETVAAALGALWRLVSDVGFTPVLDHCAECQTKIPDAADATFSHVAGGTLCVLCERHAPGGRRLPSAARLALRAWLEGGVGDISPLNARAHQRLLREFLQHHLTDGRELRAYQVWEQGRWSDA